MRCSFWAKWAAERHSRDDNSLLTVPGHLALRMQAEGVCTAHSFLCSVFSRCHTAVWNWDGFFVVVWMFLSPPDPGTLWLLFHPALRRHGLFYVWINAVLFCFLHWILYLLFPKMIWFSLSFQTHMIAISRYKIELRNKRLNMLIMYIWFVFIVLRCVLIGSLPTSCKLQSVRAETCFILKPVRFFPLSAESSGKAPTVVSSSLI